MKTMLTNRKRLLSGVMTIAFLCGITVMAHSQSKPAGKPWAAPEASAKMKNPVKSDEASLTEGKALYAQTCKACHGAKGKGDGPKAANLDISCNDFTSKAFTSETDGSIFWKITEGRKPMPAYKDKLSDSERWSLVNYIRSLGK